MRLIALGFLSALLLCSTGCRSGKAASNNQPKEQLLEVFDVQGSEATARLTVDGTEIFTTRVYIGRSGIGKTAEGDGKTPSGTLHITGAFGVKPNPGTELPYLDVTPSTFACDEETPWYNQIIDTAAVHHACKGEDMFKMVPDYNYGLMTDYNADCTYPLGSNIFIHCKGHKTSTAGCIAFDEERMLDILRHCDLSLVVSISE